MKAQIANKNMAEDIRLSKVLGWLLFRSDELDVIIVNNNVVHGSCQEKIDKHLITFVTGLYERRFFLNLHFEILRHEIKSP